MTALKVKSATRNSRICLAVRVSLVAVILGLSSMARPYDAQGQTMMASPDKPLAPASREDLLARIEILRAMVYDPDARFSRSQTLSDLRVLAKDAEVRGDAPEALRSALLMIGLIESKGGDPKEVIAALSRALAITGTTPLPPERLARTHHMLADHLKDTKDFAGAATHFRHAIKFMTVAPVFTEDHRLGAGQDLGYVLHEAKRYQEALDNNLMVLAGGERVHGATSPLLRSVITNIAQNLHALNRKAEAEPYLLRALALARAEGKMWNEQDLLFQLGVLAFETGRNDEALRHMRERLRLVTSHKRKDLMLDATEDLKILEDKIRLGSRR